MRRLGFIALPFILLAFIPRPLVAGDPTAHSAAMIKAAQRVAAQPMYTQDAQSEHHASIFTGGGSHCTSSVASIPLPPGAKKGDQVKLVLSDPQGHHAGLSSLYMKRGGTWMKVDPGVSMLTPDDQNNGFQYQATFVLPF